MPSQTRLAPAKLNLFLHITGRRADGYHHLQTVFQFIDLCDRLHFVRRADGELNCLSDAPGLKPEDDLVLRAARRLQAFAHSHWGADIRVEKRIPMGAGLGGGSSDAATTLLALNELWDLRLSPSQLCELGLGLGADVPVFVGGQAAWAEGIGECLTPLADLPTPYYLVVKPACAVSTAAIFSDYQLTRNTQSITMVDFLAGNVRNDCEAVVCTHYPEVAQALDCLRQYAPAMLTGTGACVFAAFTEVTAMQQIQAILPATWQSWQVRGLNQSPALQVFPTHN